MKNHLQHNPLNPEGLTTEVRFQLDKGFHPSMYYTMIVSFSHLWTMADNMAYYYTSQIIITDTSLYTNKTFLDSRCHALMYGLSFTLFTLNYFTIS